MPRLPFLRFGQTFYSVALMFMGLALAATSRAVAGPVPTIIIMDSAGQAPFTAHVHGLNSSLGSGNELTARYEWDFGDPNGQYNTLAGWNAAHMYDQPGTYTIKLKITNQSGQFATATAAITVTAANRTTIYVSPTGNDTNSGTTQSAPIQTFAKASQLLGPNKAILFQRGSTFTLSSTMTINHENVLIGAYGSGTNPVFNYTAGGQWSKMIDMGGAARDVLIENIRFDSPFAPNNTIVRGVQPHGNNITVRHCHFGKVSYAFNTGGSNGVNGFLTLGNTTDVIGAYYVWAEGANHVHLGNTVGGSVDEHNIRLGYAQRVLIAHNDLTNFAKSTIWCMLGDHCYVGNNMLREGRFIGGPNYATSAPEERYSWLVFENNQMINKGVELLSGAEHMMFRNNAIVHHGGDCFSISGYYAPWNRTCVDITVANNTGVNSSTQYGKFLKLGADAQQITVANNLYCATGLNPPWGSYNAYIDDNDLTSHNFHHNLWANPASGSYVHFLSAGKTVAQWDGYNQTANEMYRTYTPSDLNSLFSPQFGANLGQAAMGVHKDMYGIPRPLTGTVTVGAVQSP